MSLVMFFTDEHGFLATDQLVFSAQELRWLQDANEMASELSASIAQQALDNDKTRSEAYRAGFALGLEQAKAQQAEKLQDVLISLNKAYERDVADLQASCAVLAVDIVRKIAGNITSHDWLFAEASTAAAELVDQSSLTLRVHASEHAAVSERAKSSNLFTRVVADENVELNACCIDTRYGTIDVNLDAQIDQVMCLLSVGNSLDV